MKRLLIFLCVAAVALLAVLKAAAAGWLGLSLKMEVRPLEAITLAVNLLIALFLQRFFATRMTDLRAEKNVLISSAQEVLRALSELRERTDEIQQKASLSAKEKNAVLQGARRLSNSITELQDCIAMSSFGTMMEHIPGIWNDYYSLKQRATGGFFPTRGYTFSEKSGMEPLFRSFGTNCRGLIFKINRAGK